MAAHSLIDGTDPAQAQVAPRMELARALIQSGADTSPAYPMQAIARAIQPLAGHMIQRDATSELARLYASQAGGLAGAFKGMPGSEALVAALNNPETAPFALQHAGKALTELPKEAEDRRRFGITSGLAREKFENEKEHSEKTYGPVGSNPDGSPSYGWRYFKTGNVVPTHLADTESGGGAAPAAAASIPIVTSNEQIYMKNPDGSRKYPPGTKVRIADENGVVQGVTTIPR